MDANSEKNKQEKKEKNNKIYHPYTLYPPSKVSSTLATLTVSPNLRSAAKQTGVSQETISRWRKMDSKQFEELQQIAQERFITSATSVIDKAMERIEKAIDEGYDDPYKLTLMASILYDKRALALGQSTQNISGVMRIEDFPEHKPNRYEGR
jgi:hypothetical protein